MQEIAAGCLSTTEQALFATFRLAKRRQEWLGGRLAGKHALLRVLDLPSDTALSSISIQASASGRPKAAAKRGSNFDDAVDGLSLSLTHSDRYAVALVTRTGQCGVDLQKIEQKIVGLKERFVNSSEDRALQRDLPNRPLATRLTLLWSAKEAVKKCFLHDQPSFLRRVQLVGIKEKSDEIMTLRCLCDHQEVLVHGTWREEYALAYCWSNEEQYA
jgi:phosphopantetheinyl transferase